MELTRSDIDLIHSALTEQKSRATADGRIWVQHTQNARLRTQLAQLWSLALG